MISRSIGDGAKFSGMLFTDKPRFSPMRRTPWRRSASWIACCQARSVSLAWKSRLHSFDTEACFSSALQASSGACSFAARHDARSSNSAPSWLGITISSSVSSSSSTTPSARNASLLALSASRLACTKSSLELELLRNATRDALSALACAAASASFCTLSASRLSASALQMDAAFSSSSSTTGATPSPKKRACDSWTASRSHSHASYKAGPSMLETCLHNCRCTSRKTPGGSNAFRNNNRGGPRTG
mmetsp:Transcript_1458/g.4036  ORF Transcript_1458/g.4036 Transcript_1458/m.4036 type:complete len:246 (-) Transcript_1458:67-804(-)